jgi:RNA-directed DNA polymerase
MLEALERGVKGGKWHSLIDKVYQSGNLIDAWEQVKKNHGGSGVDRMTLHQFSEHLTSRLETLQKQVQEGSYEPLPVRRAYIPKLGGGRRPLGIPTVKDRVVQAALRNVIEPIFENQFDENSYGFRPGRGCKDALREVDRLLKAGKTWVVDVDIEAYFDSIPFDTLMDEVAERIADGRVLKLIEGFLRQGILEEMKLWLPEKGTPQGAVISPLLANIYLHSVDRKMREAGYPMIRYADDMVILCDSRDEADAALAVLRQLLEHKQLRLHPKKTKVVDATQRPGFQFLGYNFFEGKRYPRKPSVDKLREQIRKRTRRKRSDNLKTIIESLNKVLLGWFNYFKHSSSYAFEAIDRWIRYRLRCILSKRRGQGRKRRRGRGFDHLRWPNDYFRAQNLFILHEAHLCARRSRAG